MLASAYHKTMPDRTISVTFAQPSEENDFLADYIAILCDNLKRHTGKTLITPAADSRTTAKMIWHAPFVLASHTADSNPLFAYANRTALKLFEMDWSQLVRTPSARSAEAVHQTERTELLEKVDKKGYIDNYSGIRISARGRRFRVKNVIIWNLKDNRGQRVGQAANFSDWEFID